MEPVAEEHEVESMKKEIDELKDRNTALQVQIREYSETVMDHQKVCVYVHVYMYVWGLALDPWVVSSSPTTRR